MSLRDKLTTAGVAIGIAAAVTAGAALVSMPHWFRASYEVEITGTERIPEDNDSFYLIYTRDLETGEERTFRNEDTWAECLYSFDCKFDSSDVQGRAEAFDEDDARVRVNAYGWRVPFFSWYQNVMELEPID